MTKFEIYSNRSKKKKNFSEKKKKKKINKSIERNVANREQ